MVDTLDKRTHRQRILVTAMLKKYNWTPEQLLELSPAQAETLQNETLLLCYHILRDLEYLDSLR